MFSSGWRNRRNYASGPVLEVASEIPVLPVIWLWRFWLARGKLHILAGPPRRVKRRWHCRWQQLSRSAVCGRMVAWRRSGEW